MKPAVVLATHTTGLGAIRALGRRGVPIVALYYDANDMGFVSRYVSRAVAAPHPENAPDDFIALLEQTAADAPGALLLPTDDATLTAVSRHRDRLSRHYTVACPDETVVSRFLDKRETYELARQAGIAHPRTLSPSSVKDVEQFGSDDIYPCLVKPAFSHRYYELMGRKHALVTNKDELVAEYRRAEALGLAVVIQELIPGGDECGANYNSYRVDGEIRCEFTADKVRMAPPGGGVPRVVVSRRIPELSDAGRAILRAMEYSGYSCTEFKRDPRDGLYKLLEVNGRLNRSILHAVRCGVDFPWLIYDHLINGRLPAAYAFEEGVYWIDFLHDVTQSLAQWQRERYSARQLLAPYTHPHVFAVRDWRDPAPMVRRLTNLSRRAVRRLGCGKPAEGWPQA